MFFFTKNKKKISTPQPKRLNLFGSKDKVILLLFQTHFSVDWITIKYPRNLVFEVIHL
jgi:hypothetical protein